MSAALTTDVDKRLLRTTKFPPEFNVKVDMTKVNIPVIKKWVADETTKILQTEDDVVTDLIFNLIEGTRYPNIKELQISLNGFLDKDSARFCQELWKLCVSAQDNPQGIPKELLEAKKHELIQERIEEDRAREEARKRQEAERERERRLADIRDRERREREERDRGSGIRYGRDRYRRLPRDSRSPPPRRRDGDDHYRAPPSRGPDKYIPPRSRARRDEGPRRRRSPSYGRPSSRSPSPAPRRRRRNTSSDPSRSPSRSPPRRRRNLSTERSASRDRGKADRSRRGDDRRRPRSPYTRRRSRSPRRHHPRVPPYPNGSRSPPPTRKRRTSSSRSRSRSRSPPQHRRRRSELASNDLMSRGNRRAEPRLSREASDTSFSRSRTPPQRRRRNTSSVEIEDRSITKVAAAEPLPTVAFSNTDDEYLTKDTPDKHMITPLQAREANLLREQLLKQKLLAKGIWRGKS